MEEDKPLVSIVTPTYNSGKFIEDTILSVKNQNYPNIEHIIVDGGSIDSTLEILRKYKDTYNLRWISEPDEGQSNAINKGFAMARGEIIGELDSDDVYFDTRVISSVVRYFYKYNDADLIYGDGVIINEDNLILRTCHVIMIPWFSYNRLLRVQFLFQPSSFFRREVIQDYKLDVNIDLPMDYEYYLRLAANGLKFKHVNKILSAYRMHSASKTQSRSEEAKAEKRKVQERYGQKFDTRYRLLRQFDNLLFALLAMYGVKTIMRLYFNPEKQSLAFLAKFDSLPKAILRQLHVLEI
jgi:glycosyltransferase involved in cell wall biosynthesis